MNDLEIQSHIQDTWDDIAFSFDKTRKKPWKQCIDFIDKLPIDSVVGDFACGNGRHSLEMADQCKKIIGIDISKKLLLILKKKIMIKQNIELMHGNLINIPLTNHCLDAVIYIAAIHKVWSRHQEKFKDADKNLEKININKEFLEPGDVFIYWNQDNLHIPRYYHLYDKEEIKDELIQTGFKILSINEEYISSKDKPDNYFIMVEK
ncbi:ubiquinone/menaquinone biosynthesis protein [Thermoplasmatales archaeon ex4572_165]|nr:MAG: ubiquinone/menaquinone biosynthesis protein [Thermoplasmatales archaeon ex4572_165]